jgi:hypothetical protein
VKLDVEDLEGDIWGLISGHWKTMGDLGGPSTFCFLAGGGTILK